MDTSNQDPQPSAQRQLALPSWRPGMDLTPLEEEMRVKAVAGELTDLGAGPFNLTEMQAWGEERTVRAVVLRYLLAGDQWPVDAKGVRLRGVRISGPLDLEAVSLRCPLSLDCCYLDASEPLCIDYAKASRVTLTDCWLAAGLTGEMLTARSLILSCSITGPLRLAGASLAWGLSCEGVQLTRPDEDGYALAARGIKVGGDVFLDEGFTACGAVRLTRADITGTLSCRGAKLDGQDKNGYALYARGIRVGGDVHLDEGFIASGAVRLAGADITGTLSCKGAKLGGRDQDGYALYARGIRVGGDVSLEDGSTSSGAVGLTRAGITGQLSCSGAKLDGRYNGNALFADGIKVGGDVLLNGGFTASGAVGMVSADITRTLNCRGARLTGCDENGNAMHGERMKVGGDLLLEEGFTASSAVCLLSADIAGQLSCRGAQLTGRDKAGYALHGDGIKVGGDVVVDGGFTAAGAISLSGADIAGQLRCSGAKLGAADSDGDALVADGLKTGGGVYLDDGFTAAGAIRLAGADITGELGCRGALLTGADKRGNTLVGGGMKVSDTVWLNEGFTAAGTVSLFSARAGGSVVLAPAKLPGANEVAFNFNATRAQIAGALRWVPAGQVFGRVNLEGASVGELEDDWSDERLNGFWPTGRQLRIDGLTYGRFGGDQQATVEQRLDWIHSQYRGDNPAAFAPQPYEQLAAVYRRGGQDSQARKVAIARRADLRKCGDLNAYRRFGNWFLGWSIAYGYKTWRAGIGLAAVFVVFVVLSFLAQQHHLMVPIGDTEGLHSVPSATKCTSSYPCFFPVGYAVDTVIPIINVHQADNWGPNGGTPWGEAFVIGTWIATGLGWALATLLVAGYTGLVRQD
jgi:hypothetical protein